MRRILVAALYGIANVAWGDAQFDADTKACTTLPVHSRESKACYDAAADEFHVRLTASEAARRAREAEAETQKRERDASKRQATAKRKCRHGWTARDAGQGIRAPHHQPLPGA